MEFKNSLNEWEMKNKLRLLNINSNRKNRDLKSLQDQFIKQNNSIIKANAKYAAQVRKQESVIQDNQNTIFELRMEINNLKSLQIINMEKCTKSQNIALDLSIKLAHAKAEILVLTSNIIEIIQDLSLFTDSSILTNNEILNELSTISKLPKNHALKNKNIDNVDLQSNLDKSISFSISRADGLPFSNKNLKSKSKGPAVKLYSIAEYQKNIEDNAIVPDSSITISPPDSFFPKSKVISKSQSPVLAKNTQKPRRLDLERSHIPNTKTPKVKNYVYDAVKTPCNNSQIKKIENNNNEDSNSNKHDEIVAVQSARTARRKSISYVLPSLKSKLRQMPSPEEKESDIGVKDTHGKSHSKTPKVKNHVYDAVKTPCNNSQIKKIENTNNEDSNSNKHDEIVAVQSARTARRKSISYVLPSLKSKLRQDELIKGVDKRYNYEYDINILFHDSDYLIVNKPKNLRVDGPTTQSPTLEDDLMRHFNKKLYLVHQLDYVTSGIHCWALNKPAARRISKMFYRKQIQKQYTAIVKGHLKQDDFIINLGITEIPNSQKMMISDSVDAKSSISSVAVLNRGFISTTACSHVLLSPKTGRKHQLRLHLSAIGHPILGDSLYDPKFTPDEIPECLMYTTFLHSWKIEIPLPNPLILTTIDPFKSLLHYKPNEFILDTNKSN